MVILGLALEHHFLLNTAHLPCHHNYIMFHFEILLELVVSWG